MRETVHSTASLSAEDDQSAAKQFSELARLHWVSSLDLGSVPEQFRYAFILTMMQQNFERMVNASKFGALIAAALMVVIDVLNLPHLSSEALSNAFFPHISLLIALLCGYLAGRRLLGRGLDAPLWQFFAWGTFFRGCYTVIAYWMFYQISIAGGGIAAPYAVFIGLITAGLYADKRYTLMLVILNAIVYTAIVLFTQSDSRILTESLFCGYSVLAIAGLSSDILFRSFRQEFAVNKQIEEERRKAQELNVQLSDANEEVSRQMELLNEQAREIEITNTTLQEKSIELEQERNVLEGLYRELNFERDKSEELLQNILPRSIAQRLKSGEDNIANHFENVTVLFADIVGFTQMSATRSAWDIVSLLNRVFSAFDIFSEQYNLEKIKTIGDAYMIVGGLPEAREDHAEAVARMALEMLATVELLSKTLEVQVSLRIGIHTGSVVAGVIGKKKFAYDLWGDTVNTASRMESHGEAGRIHVSETVYAILHEKFLFEEREEIEVKGKGRMKTYFLTAPIV